MMLIDLKKTDKAALRQKTLQKAPLRSSGKIGSDIRALRRSRNWTLADLAEQLDRSVGWLSQVERNVSEPSLDDIRKIAGLFWCAELLFLNLFGSMVSHYKSIWASK